MPMKRLRMVLVVALVVEFLTPLPAQDSKKGDLPTRMVQGTVVDGKENVVSGAIVQLKDARSLQVRSFIALEDGKYHFTGLKVDNDYELKADHGCMTSGWRRLSTFDTRKEPVMNLKLDKKQEQEPQEQQK